MRCSKAQDRLMAYHDGELSAAGSRKIEKHLAVCTECAQLLERLVRADQAAGTAGVPGVPGPDDRYWESFTPRVLDRVEEYAATRVPVSEKRSRPLMPMAFPRLVPAVSIALVVVVSAGVLIKIRRVAPVPEAPISAYAPRDMAAEEPVYREPARRGQDLKGDKATGEITDLSERESKDSRREIVEEAPAAPKGTFGTEPEEETAPPAQMEITVLEPETGASILSQTEPAREREAAVKAPPSPVPSPGPEVDSATKTSVSLKTAAMADEASVEPEGNIEPVPSAPAFKGPGRESAAEPALKARIEEAVLAPAGTVPLPESPVPGKIEETQPPEAAKAALVQENASVDDLDTVGGSALEAAGDVQLPGIQAYDQEEEQAAGPVETPSPALSPDAGDTFEAALPGPSENLTEVRKTSGARPSLYREPRQQLEHARRLAEVRKYWESEQILKDLISQKPSSPVYEEASILMVDVLSNQNRMIEAQRFLDEAKQQFPTNDMVQQYRLGSPAPVQ